MSIHVQLSFEAQSMLKAQRRNSTISSLIISLLLITLVGLILCMFLLPRIENTIPDIITYEANIDMQKEMQVQKFNTQISRKPSAPSSSIAKVVAANIVSDLSVPVPDDVSEVSVDYGDGEDFGGGWGDDGFGDGGLRIFGKHLKVKSLTVIMDVSGSMSPHLPYVMNEIDKVAPGSALILVWGCTFEDRGMWVKGDG